MEYKNKMSSAYHKKIMTKEEKSALLKDYADSFIPGKDRFTANRLAVKYGISTMTVYNTVKKYGKWEFSYTDPLTLEK